MRESQTVSFVVELWPDGGGKEERSFGTISEAQEFIERCMDEERYRRMDMFRVTYRRQRIQVTRGG